VPTKAHAQEPIPSPDFYLILDQCKTTVGHLVPSKKGITETHPKPVHFVCSRDAQKVDCEMLFPDGGEGINGSTAHFEVKLDIPPYLYLANKNFGDFVAINVVSHSVVVVTRMLEDEYAGSKVCHGKFATGYEMDRMFGGVLK
jgi:hypothetical protein